MMDQPNDQVSLQAALIELAKLRVQEGQQAALIQEMETLLHASDAYKVLEAMRLGQAENHAKVTEADDLVRTRALAFHARTGNRKPMTGIELKEFKVVDFDPAVALAWCEVNASVFVIHTLDKTGFRSSAPKMKDAPITIRQEMRPMISKDLSAYLTPTGYITKINEEGPRKG